MPNWLKNILIKLKLFKAEETEEVPRVNVRDVDFDALNRRSELLRKLSNEQHIATTKPAEEQLVCPSCGERADEIVTCVKCGKQICNSCGTYCSEAVSVEGGESVPAGYYCEDCW